MTGFANSTIAALCYANETEIDFQELSHELGRALWTNPEGQLDIDAAYDDFVVYDLATMRICLAYTRLAGALPDAETAPRFAECIVVSVGPGPDGVPAGPGTEDRAAICQGLADRITMHCGPERLIVREYPGAFDADAHDALVEDIATPRARNLTAPYDPRTEELMWEMAQKAWSETAPAPEPQPEYSADVIDITAAKAARDATPEEDDEDALWDRDPESQPIVHRAAVNGLNAAMLVFALPVGAALLTLAVLGRESLGFSARTTAITGSVMGASQTDVAQSLLAMLS
ncbi:hypothetical protein [Sinisalibacter lacisalsi]|uniref:Uncharacterized protein n=1 Tax=Sinisalibacter lacisalsi TaxID=1526570 RepID=A0ABQ1QLC7_9RHOB|nr:hypothetical protein [Sinisalibacter lacisalsi]GGD33101.1 hypothetical protein GCM10011358_16510 [Sinisalibacter lacisalsi]